LQRFELSERIYGSYTSSALAGLQKHLSYLLKGLKAEVKIAEVTSKGWVVVEVSGEDEGVAATYLSQQLGRAPSGLNELSPESLVRGRVADSGKIGYGLYVDFGVRDTDALIPLHALRAQLAKGKTLSVRKLIELYCLHDNFPLEIRITDLKLERGEVSAEISGGQMLRFRSWIDSMLEGLLILGVPENQIRSALRKTRHERDIVRIEYLGFLEHSVVCKIGTQAPGLIAALGPLLPRVPMYAFNPKKVRSAIEVAGN